MTLRTTDEHKRLASGYAHAMGTPTGTACPVCGAELFHPIMATLPTLTPDPPPDNCFCRACSHTMYLPPLPLVGHGVSDCMQPPITYPEVVEPLEPPEQEPSIGEVMLFTAVATIVLTAIGCVLWMHVF